MPENKTVLVTGATGGQGGAVARALLAGGWSVRALVRDPDKPAAKALRVLGAEPVTGDLDEPDSLIAATRGVYGVYSVQAADLTNPDPDAEVGQGTNIADAAEAAGVAHFVYGSVAAVGHGSGVRHFGTKERIEAHLDSLGLPVTVLRPTFFMENWHSMMPPAQDGERVASLALDADTPLQMIALGDLGRIAAEAFGAPEKYIGRKTEIAGDELTPRQIAAAFAASDGVPTRFERQPIDEVRRFAPELAAMFDWLGATGYRADIPTLRRRHPGLLTLEAWLAGSR
ncbi:NmrA/HSCARG family protein [Streptomyces sp. NPDC058762]|uniref:NmrA/HSCARG family protein n=1 Tax=Streptomyces sp. NPDC058762 TaxID=3346629 RepID=UPI0036806AA3